MKRIGNVVSNRTYNPQNTKAPIPLDVDEVDAAIERFIRQKYDQRFFSGSHTVRPPLRHDTGSTGSPEEEPPPLPPKTVRRFFGLRAASSAYPLSRTVRHSPPLSPISRTEFSPVPSSSIRANKQSRVFGASIGGSGDNLDSKLATLKDMGFPDDKRNLNVLKGLGGNLERAIESLVRLGEGGRAESLSRTPLQGRVTEPGLPTPTSMDSASYRETEKLPETRFQAGIQIQRPSPIETQTQQQPINEISFSSTNPFQQQPYNPFDVSNQYSAPLQPPEAMFQNMHITQPLFPNATGGYPSQQQQLQQARLQQSMTPPVPQLPQQYAYSNPFAQPVNNSYNPFLQPTQQGTPISANLAPSAQPVNAQSSHLNSNGYSTQPTPTQHQPQQAQYQPLAAQDKQPQNVFNPAYPGHNLTQYTPTDDQFQYRPPTQALVSQPTGRFDKTSILALYNYPQLAPQRDPNGSFSLEPGSPTHPSTAKHPSSMPLSQSQRSVTMPTALSAGSKNPFLSSSSTPPTPQPNGASGRHVSQDSIDAGGLQNGRHSPDAFASLSARFVR